MSESALINLDLAEIDCDAEFVHLIKRAHDLGLLGRVNTSAGWVFLEHGDKKAWMKNEVKNYLKREIEKKEYEKKEREKAERTIREREMVENEGSSWYERRNADRASRGGYVEMLMAQAQEIIGKGYLPYCGKSEAEFLNEYIAPLAKKIHTPEYELPNFEKVLAVGRIPLLLVLPLNLVPAGAQVYRIELDGEHGDTFSVTNPEFDNLTNAVIRYEGNPCLILDVDNGRCKLGKSASEAMTELEREGRFPLVVAEGISLLTHYPETLKCHKVMMGIYPLDLVPYCYLDRRTPTFSLLRHSALEDKQFGLASYGIAIGKEEPFHGGAGFVKIL